MIQLYILYCIVKKYASSLFCIIYKDFYSSLLHKTNQDVKMPYFYSIFLISKNTVRITSKYDSLHLKDFLIPHLSSKHSFFLTTSMSSRQMDIKNEIDSKVFIWQSLNSLLCSNHDTCLKVRKQKLVTKWILCAILQSAKFRNCIKVFKTGEKWVTDLAENCECQDNLSKLSAFNATKQKQKPTNY